MMRSWRWVMLVMLVTALPLQAAVKVTVEDEGEVSQQYFEDGAFLLLQRDRPAFGIDRQGNCWFIERGSLVSDPCEKMLDAMSSVRDQAMAGLGPQERAMMEQMMGTRRTPAPVAVTAAGERVIAGYPSTCHAIGSDREVCISARLLAEIKGEMGDGRFNEMLQRFGESAARMGVEDPAAQAMTGLLDRGYPMSDMRRAAAATIPGLDPAMLQYLPEAQRAQLMQQLGMSAGGAQQAMQGSRVTRVDRNVAMPKVDLSAYRRIGFEAFIRQSMAR